jgi:hypothetical protein
MAKHQGYEIIKSFIPNIIKPIVCKSLFRIGLVRKFGLFGHPAPRIGLQGALAGKTFIRF